MLAGALIGNILEYYDIAFSHSTGGDFWCITPPLCVYVVDQTGIITSPAIGIILASILGLIAVNYANRVVNKLQSTKVSLSISPYFTVGLTCCLFVDIQIVLAWEIFAKCLFKPGVLIP